MMETGLYLSITSSRLILRRFVIPFQMFLPAVVEMEIALDGCLAQGRSLTFTLSGLCDLICILRGLVMSSF
jgi:hypothetical protein